MKKLEGKVAWISGANSGIGEATARLFAHEGAKVAIVGRRSALNRRSATALTSDGFQALPIRGDVSSEAQVRDAIEQTWKKFGRLDILINNAGMVHINPLHPYSHNAWDHVIAVNVTSMFFALTP